jgi:hypothetical protein
MMLNKKRGFKNGSADFDGESADTVFFDKKHFK